MPSEDTLERVLRRIEPTEIEGSMRSCAKELLSDLSGKHICIDGKEHRGTIPEGSKHGLVRTVSVWLAKDKLIFGQTQIESKTNEKTAIPTLIETQDLKESIVTIDAIACSQNITGKIIDKKADYLIVLKKTREPSLSRSMIGW